MPDKKLYPKTALALLTALNLLNYIDRNMLLGVQPLVQKEFHINDAQTGLLTSVFFFCYMFACPVVGWMGDRFPRKNIILIGIAVWSGFTLLTWLVRDYNQLLFRHTIVGIGEASYATIAPTLVADLFPIERRGRMEVSIPLLKPPRRRLEPGAPAEPPRRDLAFFNGLGGFSHDGREYVMILRAGRTTPAPWVNVIANPQFGTVVSESGCAYTWLENSHEFRLTPWYNDPVSDTSGEAVYLRDEETGWQQGDRVEILAGLKAGDRVVTAGAFLLDSESRMKSSTGRSGRL